MSVIAVTDVKKNASGVIPLKNISINNSTIQFYCPQTAPVTLSMYALNGHLVERSSTRH